MLYAKKMGLKVFWISAKENLGITEMFDHIVELLVNNQVNMKKSWVQNNTELSKSLFKHKEKKEGCCKN